MRKVFTREQRAILANLVLRNGYDNLREFWGEIDGVESLPPYEICEPVLFSWHSRIIDLADKAPLPTFKETT